MKLRVLQWNIWYLENIHKVIDVIRTINPDIACLQELSGNTEANPGLNTDELIGQALAFNAFVVKAQEWKGWHKDYQANGIFSKYPITKKSAHFLTSPHPVDEIDWSKEGRVYLEAELSINGKNIIFGTTHLSYTDRFVCGYERQAEEDNLKKILLNRVQSFFFCGDLNAPENSAIVSFLNTNYVNCGPPVEEKTWTTKPFNYRGFKENSLRWRLDYAFASNDIKVNHAYIFETEVSDHLPLIVEIEV